MAADRDSALLASYISKILGGVALGSGSPNGAALRSMVSRGYMNGSNFGPARQGGRDFVFEQNYNETREPNLPSVSNIDTAIKAAQALAKDEVSDPLDFDAGVVYIPGAAQNNAGLDRSPSNLLSFIRQTPEEHKQALEQYLNKDNIPPEKAVQLGKKAEEALDKWWNDKEPRRPVTPTSSAVKKVRLGPNGDIYVTFASGNKEYQYEGSPDPVKASEILQELVTSPSIGKYVNSWSGPWGQAHTYLPKG